jgi:hypothetical protein
MDLPRLYAMNDYWQQHPPVHIMVAAYLGIKPAATSNISTPVQNDESELAEFLAMLAPA